MRHLPLAVLALALTACGGQRDEKPAPPQPTAAVAVLHATTGHTAVGTVRFTTIENGLRVVADLRGLPPGKHGFHVHEWGDMTSPDLMTTGDHFNPGGHVHGGPLADQRHLGDLGNVDIGPDGSVRYQAFMPGGTLTGTHGVVGRAIILHANADDLASQPSGNAGPRIAGGVIGFVKP